MKHLVELVVLVQRTKNKNMTLEQIFYRFCKDENVYDDVVKVRGMDIVFVTTAKTNEEAYDLLKGFGMPFKK